MVCLVLCRVPRCRGGGSEASRRRESAFRTGRNKEEDGRSGERATDSFPGLCIWYIRCPFMTCPPSLSVCQFGITSPPPFRLLKTGIHSATGFRSPGKSDACERRAVLLFRSATAVPSDRLMDTRRTASPSKLNYAMHCTLDNVSLPSTLSADPAESSFRPQLDPPMIGPDDSSSSMSRRSSSSSE